MNSYFCRFVQRLVVEEDGPTAVEYAVMLALIVAVCLMAILTVGIGARDVWQDSSTKLDEILPI